MTTERNKALVRMFIEEIFVKGRPEAVDELVADDFTAHTWGDAAGRDGLRAAMGRVAKGLADATFTIDDMIAEGDRVVTHLSGSGTQLGEFRGVPPTGNRVGLRVIVISRLLDLQIVEEWGTLAWE